MHSFRGTLECVGSKVLYLYAWDLLLSHNLIFRTWLLNLNRSLLYVGFIY